MKMSMASSWYSSLCSRLSSSSDSRPTWVYFTLSYMLMIVVCLTILPCFSFVIIRVNNDNWRRPKNKGWVGSNSIDMVDNSKNGVRRGEALCYHILTFC